jgi:hypothetical protein
MDNVRFNEFTVDADTGIGLPVAPGVPGYDPQMILKYSKDRGKTWSDERPESMGKMGETEKRIIWPQLGSSRIGWLVSVVVTEPVPLSINGAFVRMGPA